MNQSNKGPSESLQFAFALHQTGDLNGAAKIYRQLIEADPRNFPALHYLGVIEAAFGNYEQAARLMARSVAGKPPNIQFIENYAALSYKAGKYETALQLCEQGLKIERNYVPLIYLSAVSFLQLKRLQESLAAFDTVLSLQPNHVIAVNERGTVLATMGRFDEALPCFEKASVLNPQYADAALNRGNLFGQLKRLDEALAAFDKALTLKPGLAEAWLGRAKVLKNLKRFDEALPAYDQALTLKPDLAEAWFGHGVVLNELERHEDAARSFERLVELAPDYPFAKGFLIHQRMLCCDWEGYHSIIQSIENELRAGKKSAEPFGYQSISNSPHDVKRCTEIYAAENQPRQQAVLWTGERYHNSKIRIGYSSGEFRHHAVSILMTELFELHDKNRFELFAFDNGWDDGSNYRKRINQAFDTIINIRQLMDAQAAAIIKQNKIDVLINLNGYFGEQRMGVFSHKPAPIQVNYLGYLATMGVDYIDYILADRFVIPAEHQAFYTEKVVHLPDTYQVNDTKRSISERTPTRAKVQLSEKGFVFCCFNNNFKITPKIFDVWMRLLNKLEGSVLWLLEDNAAVTRNLRSEAEARGISPARLVFAPRIDYPDYLARYRLADLFLDTLPFNAGTTASDALWAGLPLVTCSGETFAARVAGSLLNAVGLPELVTKSLEEYEALALKLARDPVLLASLKEKLARNRDTYPLFNSKRFTRHIEAAYTTMWEKYQRGEPPASFAVDPID
jgi:predicted O-linked N-acetylglucosamine transferase (SPINDLY family)